MDQQLKAEREKQEAEERAAAKMQLSRWKVSSMAACIIHALSISRNYISKQ